MVLATIAVTRTGPQEGLGTEEGTAEGAHTAAPRGSEQHWHLAETLGKSA